MVGDNENRLGVLRRRRKTWRMSKSDQIHSLFDKLGNNWARRVVTDGARGAVSRVVIG